MQNFSLIRRGTGNAVLEPTKIPTLRDDYVLVKTVAVALNPTDWTTLDAVGDDGTIVGCDYAGVVEDVGRDAAQHFRKGDRIAGFGHGGIVYAAQREMDCGQVLKYAQATMQIRRTGHLHATLPSKLVSRYTSPMMSLSKPRPQ